MVQRIVYNYCAVICTREQTKICFVQYLKNHRHLLTAIYCKMQDHRFKHQTHTNTHTLQPLYLYRTGDLIRGDYWHSKVQTNAKLNCCSNNQLKFQKYLNCVQFQRNRSSGMIQMSMSFCTHQRRNNTLPEDTISELPSM